MIQRGRAAFVVSFLSPAILLYGLFVVWPLLEAFHLSLFQWRGVSAKKTFVGVQNFTDLGHDGVFWVALKNNLWMLFAGGLALIVLGVSIAHAMRAKGKISKGIRAIVLFPQVISMVVVAILWMFLYNPAFGLINSGLRGVGLEGWAKAWLGESGTALPAVIVAFVWYAVGFYIMLFSAGLRSIPEEVTEAAELDGSEGWHRFQHITWPMLWSMKRVAFTYVVIMVMNVFALVYLMTQGGPDRSTEVMLTYLYQQAFTNNKFGYATALAVANFAVAMALSLGVLAYFRRDPQERRT